MAIIRRTYKQWLLYSQKKDVYYLKAQKSAVLPDTLWCKVPIYKSKELTERIVCADSLTVLIACSEQGFVVCSEKVHILINWKF